MLCGICHTAAMGLWSVLNIHNEVGPSGVSAKGWPHLVRSLRELMEKQLSQGSYTDIRVLEAERQSCNVAFHFHHVVQDQMGQHHHRVLSHPCNPRAALAPTDLLFQLQRIASAMKLFSVVAPPPPWPSQIHETSKPAIASGVRKLYQWFGLGRRKAFGFGIM